ncbi:hypothetical protein OXX80_002060 [Metschnikowia pulcherrima]
MYSAKVTEHINQGAKLFASKEYEQAASQYADACAAFNDEHSRDDPDLLLQYGKSLFEDAMAKSSVLGGISGMRAKADAEKEANQLENPEEEEQEDDGFAFHEGVAEEEEEESDHDENDIKNNENGGEQGSLDAANEDDEGAANEDASADEGNASDDSEEEEEAESETEFEAAWKVLESARLLYEDEVKKHEEEKKQLKEPYLDSDADVPKTKYVESLKKLADTFDLLGEVSMESENLPQASSDFKQCLDLRQQLYHRDSSAHIASAHVKFASAAGFFYTTREDAAKSIKQAIKITENLAKAADADADKKNDYTSMLGELNDKYAELTRDISEEQDEQQRMMQTIMSQFMGSGSAEAPAESVSAAVNDLSAMVKKRKAKPEGATKKPRND